VIDFKRFQFPADWKRVTVIAWTSTMVTLATFIGLVITTRDELPRWALNNSNRFPLEAIIEGSKTTLRGSTLFSVLFWLIVFAAVLGWIFLFFSTRETAKATQRAQTAEANAQKSLSADTANSDFHNQAKTSQAIFEELFPDANPTFRIKSVKEITTIHGDGTAEVQREYLIQAGPKGAAAWRCHIYADASAEKVRIPSDMEFQGRLMQERSNEKLHWIATKDEDTTKVYLLYFSPTVEPDATRKLSITYRWPRFAGDLLKNGETTFFVNFKSLGDEDLADVSYELRFAEEIGDLHVEPKSDLLGGIFKPEKVNSYRCWSYEHHALRVAGAELTFHARKKVRA
jgi:hypothetical protein